MTQSWNTANTMQFEWLPEDKLGLCQRAIPLQSSSTRITAFHKQSAKTLAPKHQSIWLRVNRHPVSSPCLPNGRRSGRKGSECCILFHMRWMRFEFEIEGPSPLRPTESSCVSFGVALGWPIPFLASSSSDGLEKRTRLRDSQPWIKPDN